MHLRVIEKLYYYDTVSSNTPVKGEVFVLSKGLCR